MSSSTTFGLPRQLGQGLTLRWATPDDAEALAQLNMQVHSDDPAEPSMFLYHWTRDLMRGDHPTTKADDFTVVVDENAGGRIVSTLNLISQTWAYEDIPFRVGRPELVGTLPEYRRRGLVRQQMDVIHARSAARGELVQAITGIPWYYRQFGYEMALNLGGSRQLFWLRPGNSEKVEQETYRLRPATVEDIPQLADLYRAHLGRSLISRVRNDAQWHYEIFVSHPESIGKIKPQMVMTPDGRVVAYVVYNIFGTAAHVSEIGVSAGHSWRAVARFLVRHLQQEAETLNQARAEDKQISNIHFGLGEEHSVYDALGHDLERPIRPYAWYIRVPDIPAFLRHIAPALERRLAGSVMAGHTGTVKINLFRQRLTMVWEEGRLTEVGEGYAYERLDDGDALFPELTFLHLLFGHRSREEIGYAYADSYTNGRQTAALLDVLFPRRPSHVLPQE